MSKIILAEMLFILNLFTSCEVHTQFDELVYHEISSIDKRQSIEDTLLIDLKSITKFKWDKMYVFDEMTLGSEIQEELGFAYASNHVPDGYKRIIFTENESVVKCYQYFSLDATIQFRLPKGKTFFTHKESSFFAFKRSKSIIKGTFYDLYPAARNL